MFKVTIKTAERQLPCVKHKGALASSSSIFGRTLQFNRVCTITWNRPPINLKFKFFRSKFSYFLVVSSSQLAIPCPEADPKVVHKKRYSENTQQICRRTPMPKCDWKPTLLESHFGMGVLLYICCVFSEYDFL